MGGRRGESGGPSAAAALPCDCRCRGGTRCFSRADNGHHPDPARGRDVVTQLCHRATRLAWGWCVLYTAAIPEERRARRRTEVLRTSGRARTRTWSRRRCWPQRPGGLGGPHLGRTCGRSAGARFSSHVAVAGHARSGQRPGGHRRGRSARRGHRHARRALPLRQFARGVRSALAAPASLTVPSSACAHLSPLRPSLLSSAVEATRCSDRSGPFPCRPSLTSEPTSHGRASSASPAPSSPAAA